MGRPAADDLLSLLEGVLSCRLDGVVISDSEGIILKTCEINPDVPKYELALDGCTLTLITHEKTDPFFHKETIAKLINIFRYSPLETAASEVVASSRILEDITGKQSLDVVLHQLISAMIINGSFRRAGIMFLNEALLELRGVIYCNSDMKIDVTSFRNAKLTFRSKNVMSDVMFFDRTSLVNADEVDGFDDFAKYFCGNMLASGLVIGGSPIGVLVVCKEHYSRADKEAVKLFSSICSLSIEFHRTRKQLELIEKELKEARKAESNKDSLMKIGSMSATVAHELKNPLIAIEGFVDRMDETAVNPVTRSYIEIVKTEVRRLEKIVGDILTYSKRYELVYEKVNVVGLIDDVMLVLKACLNMSLINVIVNISDALYVYVDRDKFHQVLMNLVTNSVQEMPQGGTITLSSSESAKHVTISIADTGGGIPEETRDKIFETFYSRKQHGTGLGLPLCRKIMTAHGGDIFVSDSDSGAVFTLLLPKR